LIAANANKASNFSNAFDSPNYTLNKQALAIINDSITPNSNRSTFSANQPGYCDLDVNRKAVGGRCSSSIDLTAEITAANQTVKVNKYFGNAHTIDRGDGTAISNHTADTTHTYATTGDYIITLSLATNKWSF
jgi:hypothetical protein